ncbi:unnamed protein product [Rotaria magnacalcarata]|uniref:Uncharacterized protein n=2 Tax=Rotaria magnacalcarata TaxID=392030 RepID=A0A815MU46_9BILA|nr:unnamed protein product [Rotaria magnacalcarata]
MATCSNTQVIPMRPELPEYMVDMSDNDFGTKFFSEINLDYPGLVNVKTMVERGNYTIALQEWSNLFWDRTSSITDASKYSRTSWYVCNDDDLMLSDTVKFQRENLIVDYGLPFSRKSAIDMAAGSGNPSMEWHRPDSYNCYINTLAHPRVLIRKVEDIKAGVSCSFTSEQYLTRWSNITRDFVNNNWNCGLRLCKSTSATAQTLNHYQVCTAPDNWGYHHVGFMYWHIYGLHNLLESWIDSIRHLTANMNLEAKTYIPYRTTTEMCYFMMLWPGVNGADNDPHVGLIAQRTLIATDLFELSLLMPEFLRQPKLNSYSNTVFCNLADITATCPASDFNRDGTGTENSLNYMFLTHRTLKTLLGLCTDANISCMWKNAVESLITRRNKFRDNIYTNLGTQVLCAGDYQADYNSSDGRLPKPVHPVSYKSIAFPWHGLYSMRDGFTPNDFFISLHSPLRGAGHEANDVNKIMLEAFGRYMLVANAGEGSVWGSSWVQNTVQVDDRPQAKVNHPRHGAWTNPQSGLWHVGESFDMAETNYTYGYGPQESPLPPAVITSVAHKRKVIHLKNLKIALVVDKMETSDDKTHKYTQIWHFHKDFPDTNVTINSNTKIIATNQSDTANICMLQASQEPLNYSKYYGESYTGPIPAHINCIKTDGTSFRGWFNNADGYGYQNNIYPAVDVYTTFTGMGRQKIITALVPSHNTAARILSSNRIETDKMIGIEIVLTDNTEIRIYEAIGANVTFSFPNVTAEMLVLLKKPGQILWTGLYQYSDDIPINHAEFEISPNNTVLPIYHIRPPDWFNWEIDNSGHEFPLYFKGTIQPEEGMRKIYAGESVTLKVITPSDYASGYDYQWKVNGTNVGNNADSYSYNTQPNDLIECTITATPFTGDSPYTFNTNALRVCERTFTSIFICNNITKF